MNVSINEVATRDGFQAESHFIPTDDKVALIDRLGTLGYGRIEVTSFTSAQAIPALRDADEVMHRIRRAPGVVYTALVPNRRGAERAFEAGVDELNLVVSASESHNLANLRMTREQSFRQLADIAQWAQQQCVPVNVSLSCSFGCPIEGDVGVDTVLGWVERFAAFGAVGVTLCDTTGMAYPSQVRELCAAAIERQPELAFTGHFHDTRGLGGANSLAALQAGVRRFDSSLGGLGGCPYAPGASGNLATEDLVHLLDCEGHDCGIDLAALLEVHAQLQTLLPHALESRIGLAGPRGRRHPPPPDFEAIRQRALARDEQERAR